MADANFMKLTIPELKKKLTELGLPLSGKKNDLVTRLQASSKKPVLKEKRVNNTVDEPSASVVPTKKQKTAKSGDEQKTAKSADKKTKLVCVKSCRKGEKSGCAHRMYNKPSENVSHGVIISCRETERLIKAMGRDPKEVSNCTKAAIMRGFIKVKGEKADLDIVVLDEKWYGCGHVIKATVGDLLSQTDYGGMGYEEGECSTIFCKECETEDEEDNDFSGRTFVTGQCHGQARFVSGKEHNHCEKCPGFGDCTYYYDNEHCTSCGNHFNGAGIMGNGNGCDNPKCRKYKPLCFDLDSDFSDIEHNEYPSDCEFGYISD